LQDFLELAVSATASGCVYGLMALAYLLMIRPTGIINFAVGEWAMVGAFGGHFLLYRYEWPYALGMAVVIAFMLLVGWGTERVAVRPLVERGAPILGDQAHRTRMMEPEMLDDDARLHDRAVAVHEDGHALQGPQGLVLGLDLLIAGRQQAQLERDAVLVERDQHLLAVG
jgi:hypothetical protein